MRYPEIELMTTDERLDPFDEDLKLMAVRVRELKRFQNETLDMLRRKAGASGVATRVERMEEAQIRRNVSDRKLRRKLNKIRARLNALIAFIRRQR